MRPFLLNQYFSPHFTIPSFAFSLMLASLIATTVCYVMAKRRGLSQVVILDLAIIGTIMAVIGMRLFHVFVEEPRYYLEHPWHVFQVWRGGFVSYGAVIGLAVGWIAYLKIRKLDMLRYLDHMVLFGTPIVMFVVRGGCLLAGCCFGKPSPFDKFEWLLYIVFTDPRGDAGSLFPHQHLWPTQLYAMGYAVLIFLICYWFERHQKFKGQVAMVFLITYALFRSALEFLRGDVSRGVYLDGTISTAQITSMVSISIALIFYFYFKKRYPLDHPYGPDDIVPGPKK